MDLLNVKIYIFELDEVLLKFGTERVRVRNTVYNSLPAVIHGNVNTKVNVFFLCMSMNNANSVESRPEYLQSLCA